MNITLFTENYHRGGVDTFLVTLLNHWPEPEDRFTLVCNQDHPGIGDIRQRLRRPCAVVTHTVSTYAALAARTRRTLPLDLLRKAGGPLLRYLYLAHAVRKLRWVLEEQGGDRLLVVNGGYPGGDTCRAAGIAWGMYSGKPASVHNFHNLAAAPSRFSRIQENDVDGFLADHTRAFVTVSRAAAESLALRPRIARTPEKIRFIHNGIEAPGEDVDAADIRRELGVAANAPLCLVLGTYEPRKGHDFLVRVARRVMERVPGMQLVACGDGSADQIAAVRSAAAEAGIGGQVHTLGYRGDAMTLLRQADLLLIGSQEFESFGLTAVEAMARRIPVVATRVGGLPEVVADGEGGYVFARDDLDGYAARVVGLLTDPAARCEQGERGWRRYRELFTAERMAAEYAAILRPEGTE